MSNKFSSAFRFYFGSPSCSVFVPTFSWNGLYYLLYGKQSKLTKSVRSTEAAGRNKTEWSKENRTTCVVTIKLWRRHYIITVHFHIIYGRNVKALSKMFG